MKVKINYDEMDKINSYIDTKKDNIESLYGEIKKELSDVGKYWQGKDSKTFTDVSEEYINDAIESLNDLKDFNNNLNEMVKLYKESEENFNNKIRES